MKNVFRTLAILLTLNTAVMAQKEFNVDREIEINVSAEQLWEMVGPGFVEVYKWSSNVDHAEGSGKSEFEGAVCSNRSCAVNVKGFSSIAEKLTNYSIDNKTLSYEVVEGMPGFMVLAENTWTVVPISESKSKLVMKGRFSTKGLMGTMMRGMMKKKMGETLEMVLNDAKVYAETGVPSAVKQARIAEFEKKQKKAA
ncbi:MAG: SRPBCC family protein [Crocinitomicaceae bacterium]|nr:SRPBCC family protein [Crocinitomicaceae bacterium]